MRIRRTRTGIGASGRTTHHRDRSRCTLRALNGRITGRRLRSARRPRRGRPLGTTLSTPAAATAAYPARQGEPRDHIRLSAGQTPPLDRVPVDSQLPGKRRGLVDVHGHCVLDTALEYRCGQPA